MERAGSPPTRPFESVVLKKDPVHHADLLQRRHVVVQLQPNVLSNALEVFVQPR